MTKAPQHIVTKRVLRQGLLAGKAQPGSGVDRLRKYYSGSIGVIDR